MRSPYKGFKKIVLIFFVLTLLVIILAAIAMLNI